MKRKGLKRQLCITCQRELAPVKIQWAAGPVCYSILGEVIVRRKVVKTETYRPLRTRYPAFTIVDTLECGHEMHTKGSQGYAEYRFCKQCADWLECPTRKLTIGNKEEKWDSEKQMPYWVEI